MFQVVSLGSIVQDPACYAQLTGKPVVYPDHYCIYRSAFLSSTASPKPTLLYKDTAGNAPAMEQPFFTATIVLTKEESTGTTLHFTITRSDNPTEKVYRGSKSPTTVWRAALEAAAEDFPARAAQLIAPYGAKGQLQVNGARLFGLHLKEVQEELMTLPGAAAAFETAAAAVQQQQQQQQSVRTVVVSPAASQPASPSQRGSSASPKRSSRAASADAGSRVAIEAVTDDVTLVGHSSISGSQPPSVVAVTPARARRPRKSKADGAADGSAAPPTKRRRTAAKKADTNLAAANADLTATTTAAASALVVCPDCGLTGTPFCAATGKPHEIPPCPVCGLRTAFCPVSGQAHAGAAQRENRQRGEVHLPGTARKPRRKTATTAAAAPVNGEVTEVTVVSTQDGSSDILAMGKEGNGGGRAAARLPRKRRARCAAATDGASAAAATTTTVEGSRGAPARPRRSRKTTKDPTVATTTTATTTTAATDSTSGTTATAAEAVAPTAPESELSLFDLAKKSLYIYPPLRPPLSTREHHRAAQLLQESWKLQYGDGPVLPPAVAAVPLPFVLAKRSATAGAGTASAAVKGRRRGRNGDAVTVKDEEADDDAQNDTDARPNAEDAEKEKDGDDHHSALSSPAMPSATATLPSMVHPLEVTQLASSVAGKRLAKFLLQYTSERSQHDLLRSSSSGTASAAGPHAEKKPAKGKEDTSGAVQSREAENDDVVADAAAATTGVNEIKDEPELEANTSGDGVEA